MNQRMKGDKLDLGQVLDYKTFRESARVTDTGITQQTQHTNNHFNKFGSQTIRRATNIRTAQKHPTYAASFDVANQVSKVDSKLKNMKRALNITKTLFGMVDEMDTTDFCAQKDSA